jgi:hypothetical protein
MILPKCGQTEVIEHLKFYFTLVQRLSGRFLNSFISAISKTLGYMITQPLPQNQSQKTNENNL